MTPNYKTTRKEIECPEIKPIEISKETFEILMKDDPVSTRLGPYTSEKTANAVAQAFLNLGENVQVESVYEPYQPVGMRYQAYVIRGVSA